MKNKIRHTGHAVIVIILILVGITVHSCTYEKGNITKACILPDTVSFNKDILPVLNTQCSITGCHTSTDNAGNLNLQESVAYTELLHTGSGYVDTLHPEFSILYSTLVSKSNPMPPVGRLDNCQIRLILKWIGQKAKNN